MGPDDWPDWLPADWSMHIRKIDERPVKCFVHPDGYSCYSKQEVLSYENKDNTSTADEKTQNADESTIDLSLDPNAPHNELAESLPGGRPAKLTPRPSRTESHSGPVSQRTQRANGDSSWLPEGWTVEVKTRLSGKKSGMKYKCFTDPLSGQKFFSKPQVLNQLAKTGRSLGGQKEVFAEPISAIPISAWQENHSTEPDDSQIYEPTEVEESRTGKKTKSSLLSSAYEVVSRTPVDGLPAGWIKEIRTRKHGLTNRKDPYYLDPLSEYVFLSKKDALRYLESGDVTKCVMRPLLRDLNSIDIHNDNLTFTIEELTSPDPSKGIESPGELPNGSVEELNTYKSSTEDPKPVRSITGGIFSKPEEEHPDWLPDGWVVEVLARNTGVKKRVYKETASGKKLYSKPQVLNYVNGSSSNSTKRENQIVGASFSSPEEQQSDWLPDGWAVEEHYTTNGAKYKSYMEPASGRKFYSKRQVLNYINGGSGSSNPRKRENPVAGGSFSSPEQHSDWLPDGWVAEEHYTTNGARYKSYKETASGKKFYSKPQVLNYVNGGSSNSRKRKENKSSIAADSSPNPTPADVTSSTKKKGKTKNSDYQEVITTSPADGLPPGWIKEIRTKIYATHKRNDPYYTNSETGYMFRSKADVNRYLETGDVSLCASRPKVKSVDDLQYPTGTQPVEDKQGDELPTGNHEENQTTNPETADNNTNGTIMKPRSPPADSSGRSPKRQKGVNTESDPSREKQGAWVNLEKEPGEDGNIGYNIAEEDDNWTDQCIDFAVKTLANEMLYNGQAGQEENVGVNETPAKVK